MIVSHVYISIDARELCQLPYLFAFVRYHHLVFAVGVRVPLP